MELRDWRRFAGLLLFALSGCRSNETTAPGPDPAPAAPSASAAAAAPEPSGGPQSELDALDGRRPVPLLPMMAHHQKQNMRDHLQAVEEIVTALAKDDFAGVEKAAGRIGSSPEMERMCNHMGAGAPGFTRQALDFHAGADTIAQAARRADRAQVLSGLGATLSKCNGCHAGFKQSVVDAKAWRAATGSAAPTPGAH